MDTTNIEGVECLVTANLNARFGFTVQGKDIVEWGIEPHARHRSAMYWSLDQVPAICDEVIRRATQVKENAK